MRQPVREVPRWRRPQTVTRSAAPVQLRGRHGKAFARELARATAQGSEGRKEGGTAAGNDVLAATGAWRFRRHLPPFAWLAFLLAAGLALHSTRHPLLFGNLAGLAAPVVMWLFTRHASRFTRRAAEVAGLLTAIWLPLLAAIGWHARVPAFLLLTWGACAALWVRHYRWRPAPPEQAATGPAGDAATWDKLAAKRKWTGQLGSPEALPGGGRKYPIRLDGAETHIGQVLAEPRAIAAAWDRAQTEAYAEPDPSGIESRGYLTILNGGTLEAGCEWDGKGFSADGLARVGRFADGMRARIRGWVPMDGTRHSLFAGASGSGKTALLDLLIWLALASEVPVVPVILDPQNGQSLPQWKGRLLYAAGLEECVRFERGLHAAMLDRSARMASMTWRDEDGFKMTGLDFYDHRVAGFPIVMPITDEAPELLGGGGNSKLGDEMTRLQASRAKLARKAGDMEVLVAQVPSLGELGGNQALRAMFVGGNVVSLRTAEKVSQGMLGLSVDPSLLPKYFPSGEPTQGVGYVASVDNRQAPMRTDMVPRRLRREQVEVPALEPEFLEAMDKAMGGVSPTAAFPAPAPSRQAPEPRDAPEPPPVDDAPEEGRRCADAVWQVLADRNAPMERGEVVKWANELAQTGWGRAKPFSIRAISDALKGLAAGEFPGREVTKPRDGVYEAVTVQSPANDAK